MSLLELKKKILHGITSNMETYFAVPTDIAIQNLIIPFAIKEHKGITTYLQQRQEQQANLGPYRLLLKAYIGKESKPEGIPLAFKTPVTWLLWPF